MPARPKIALIDKNDLENFLQRVPALSDVLENHSQLAVHFGFYLAEKGVEDVTPKWIRACYDAASISTPANITDVMQRSRSFVRTSTGTTLSREARNRIRKSLETSSGNGETAESWRPQGGTPEKARAVVVVHGRDFKLRDSMFQFLRAAGLAPIEWGEAVRRTQRGSPYTGEIVDALFREAQAIIVILSPDEHVELRTDLQSEDSADNSGWQPRPNVFIEAGMALARDEAHTILVEMGRVRHASDLVGRNTIRFDGSSTHRHDLIERLRTSGCAVSTSGSDWLRVGDFKTPPQESTEGGRKTK